MSDRRPRLFVVSGCMLVFLVVIAPAAAGTGDGAPPSLVAFEAAGRPPLPVRPAAPTMVFAPEALTFFTSRTDFDTAFPGLPVEGFENGSMAPGSIGNVPHPLDQNSSNAYFQPGDILPGIQFWAGAAHGGDEIAVLGAGFMGNPSKTAVANYFVDGYRIVFDPPVMAVGMDLQSFGSSGTCQIDIYDNEGLVASVSSACSGAGVFWGTASDANPIAQIVITDLSGGAEGADNIAFGDLVPDISITPDAFSAELCPDATTTQTLSICNIGGTPLTWALSEMVGTGPLGVATIPVRREAPAGSDQGTALPRVALANHVNSNPVLIIEDELPWYHWSTHNILTANGIGYDLVGSGQLATVDLSPYTLVIVSSAQSEAFYTAWNATVARFEAYVAGGGALWIGTATSSAGLTNPLLPGGVVLSDDVFAQYGNLAAPGHPWVAGVADPFDGLWVSHGEFSNLYPGSIVVATSATTGNPTLVDYSFGSGRVLITSLTLEIGWEYGWSEAPILQNSLVDMFTANVDVPWLSENPVAGEVAPGTCATVNVTFDSTGLASGAYSASLVIASNDTDQPELTVPVAMTVLAPVAGADFTFAPPAPVYNTAVAFSGSVTAGFEPITWSWDFGDGSTGSGQAPEHTFALPGTYTVTLTATNACGESVAQHTVTVTAPGVAVTPAALSAELCPDATATQELLVCNTGTAPLTWALSELPPSSWLGETPVSGVIAAGAPCTTITVSFDSTGLAPSPFSASLIITSDDPDQPEVSVPVAMTVLAPVAGADFTFAPPAPVYNTAVAFSGSVTAGSEPITWSWDFGDGSTGSGQAPEHTFALPGTYAVTLTATNACGESTRQHTVTVFAPGIAVTPAALSTELCPDATATQELLVCNTGASSLTWALSELPPSSWLGETPVSGVIAAGAPCTTITVSFDSTGLAPGPFSASLIITSDDPDQPEMNVPVTMTVLLPVAGADFTFTPTGPLTGAAVAFSGTVSAGAEPINYSWDFGDGTTGFGQAPTHTFALPGTFTVTLTATNACGESVAQHAITVLGVADVSIEKEVLAVGVPGSTIRYLITVTNDGPEAASMVEVTDPLPAGTAFISVTPSQGSCTGTTTVVCTLGALAPSMSATIELVITAPATPGSVVNTASVSNTPELDPTLANNAVDVTANVIAPIPTSSGWGLIAFACALLVMAIRRLR